jgi:putative dehydrogenase
MRSDVGIIGAGLMGLPIAQHWKSQGLNVIGFDVSHDRRMALNDAGLAVADSASEVADKANNIFLCLPSAEALGAVMAELGPKVGADHIIVETSTLAIADKERAAERLRLFSDAILLDCPIIGGAVQARTAKLSVLASGDEAAYRVISPLLDVIAAQHRYVGGFGQASRLKFVVNHYLSVCTVLIAETLRLAERAGLDLNQVDEVVRNSPASSPLWQARVPLMLSGVFDNPATQGGTLALPFKDTRIIASFISECGAATPMFDAALNVYRLAESQLRETQDIAALFDVIDTMATGHTFAMGKESKA